MSRDGSEIMILSAKGGNGGTSRGGGIGGTGIGQSINLGVNTSKPLRSLGSRAYVFRNVLQ